MKVPGDSPARVAVAAGVSAGRRVEAASGDAVDTATGDLSGLPERTARAITAAAATVMAPTSRPNDRPSLA